MLARNICNEIALGSLDANHLTDYLNARFSPNDFSAELAELLERKTEGHPLFATSLVDHLVERGDITLIEGVWTLSRKRAELDLEAPENVFSILRKNVEALDESELRTIQYASVEGGEFLSTVVAELLGVDDLVLEEQLDHICRVHRLVRVCGQEDLPNGDLAIRYRFSHILYQNFLYKDLAPKRRILLHRQAAELLLKLYGPEADRNAGQIAMHFERARDSSRAIEFLIQAAENARKVFANDEAEQYLTRALHLVEKLPNEEGVSKQADLYHKRGIVNQALSRFDRAIDDFARMSELGRDAGLRDVEHAALNAMGTTLFWAHRMDEMAACVDKVRRFVEVSDNQALRLESMVIMALRHQCYGELTETKPLYEEVIKVGRSIGHKPALLSALVWRSFVHFFQSEYDRAETLLTEARELATELRDGFRLLNCLFCLGVVQGNRGCIAKALRTFNEALEIAMRNGDHAVRAKLPNCIGWIYRELQDFDRAREYDQRGVEIAREDHVLEAEAHSLLNLGNNYSLALDGSNSLAAFREAEIVFGNDDWLRWRFNIRHLAGQAEHWLEQSDLERARDHSLRLLDLATRHGVHKYIAVAHRLLGQVAAENCDFNQAEAHFSAAIDELDRYPAPFVTWKTHAAFGNALLKKGDVDGAKAAFARSVQTIQQIASNIDDEALRSTFLNSTAVRKVMGDRSQA
jgi:tetratricopeptide (TPR) repeat protein